MIQTPEQYFLAALRDADITTVDGKPRPSSEWSTNWIWYIQRAMKYADWYKENVNGN